MFKAVIFDMDGTLLDTEQVSQTTWRLVASDHGVTIPDSILHAFVGCSIPNACIMLNDEFGDPNLTESLIQAHHDRFVEVAERELQTMPGAYDAVAGLKEDGYLVALATSSNRRHAQAELERFGLLPLFDAMVFGDDVSRSKPEPDIYLEAARQLGVAATDCAAVEDSFNGVRSAYRAGTQVFMVPDWNQPTREIRALCAGVLGSLAELRSAVAAGQRDVRAGAIDTVIFDMDGTLVDSELVSREAWYVTAERMGVKIPDAMLESFLGRNAASVEDELAAYLGGLARVREAFRIHIEAFDELAPSMLKLKPFAHEALDALRADGFKIGLATSTGRERAMARLARFGLQDAFDSTTCGDDGIEHGKPAPDIFLLAAERLGSAPSSCAVVEDSFSGVRAGHAAGMRVFMVPDLMQPTPEVAGLCETVLPNLSELPAAVMEAR